MGRPSLAHIRRPQLLDAYAECLVRYGVEGTTLERVAEVAGVTRGLVRHYLGNRDEVIRALGERVRDRYLEWLGSSKGSVTTIDTLADRLMLEQPPELYAVIDALFVEAPRDPHIAATLRQIYQAFERHLSAELAEALPGATPAERRRIGLAMMSFAFVDTDFGAIGFAPERRGDFRAIVSALADGHR
jgi:AcrR family transcriptional regulator